jgi:hypothetical protein
VLLEEKKKTIPCLETKNQSVVAMKLSNGGEYLDFHVTAVVCFSVYSFFYLLKDVMN